MVWFNTAISGVGFFGSHRITCNMYLCLCIWIYGLIDKNKYATNGPMNILMDLLFSQQYFFFLSFLALVCSYNIFLSDVGGGDGWRFDLINNVQMLFIRLIFLFFFLNNLGNFSKKMFIRFIQRGSDRRWIFFLILYLRCIWGDNVIWVYSLCFGKLENDLNFYC